MSQADYAPVKAVLHPPDVIPADARKWLPRRGLLFVSGGLMSAGRWLSVDFDSGQLRCAVNPRPNSPAFEPGPLVRERFLEEPVLAEVRKLAAAVWADPRPFTNTRPIIDFDVCLILAESGLYRFIQSWGPAVAEVDRLYTLLWRHDPAQSIG